MSRRAGGAWAAIVCLAAAGIACSDGGPFEVTDPPQSPFVEISSSTGLRFEHRNGMSGRHYFVEMMGGGGALLDYDLDGDLDLFLGQGGALEGEGSSPADEDRFLRSDARPPGADSDPRWVDVSATSGVRGGGYTMGAAVGDYDRDGWPDLYVLSWGRNRLLRNAGDGGFVDTTAAAGVALGGWSAAATFVDYDRDGWLDLFVARYVDYAIARDVPCYSGETGARDYCGPQSYAAERDALFHNRGDGTFEEVTADLGFGGESAAGLGVVAADFDGDGWPDLYVANDGQPNHLWLNRGGSHFVQLGLASGAALNAAGAPEASMGVTVADFDRDGHWDLLATHLRRETNTLWLGSGEAQFRDGTVAAGLASASLGRTGFGVAAIDWDNDGWRDLAIANGAVIEIPAQRAAGEPLPLNEPQQLLRNRGDGTFTEVPPSVGTGLEPGIGRGLLAGDLDNDGDADLLLLQNNGAARQLANRVGEKGRWVGLALVGAGGGVGAEVTLEVGGSTQRGRVSSDGSYGSASDARALFGLGSDEGSVSLDLRDGYGRVRRYSGLLNGRYYVVEVGDG